MRVTVNGKVRTIMVNPQYVGSHVSAVLTHAHEHWGSGRLQRDARGHLEWIRDAKQARRARP